MNSFSLKMDANIGQFIAGKELIFFATGLRVKGYVFCFFYEYEKTMTQPLFPYCCGNNRGNPFVGVVLGCVSTRRDGERGGSVFFSDYRRPNRSPLFFLLPFPLGGDGSGTVFKDSGSRRGKIWTAHLSDPSGKPPRFWYINQSN